MSGFLRRLQFQSLYLINPLKIGAGGWLVGIDINPDGTRLCRTDVYGAYLWNGSSWDQLITQSRMPAAYFGFVGSGTSQIKMNGVAGNGVQGSGGVYEICSAPSNSSIIYMMANGWIFKSINRGATFSITGTGVGTGFNSSITGTPDPVLMATNNSNRQNGRKMAIDPINPSIVYAGTDTRGLFVTTDAGASWLPVSSVPTGTGISNYNIAFDPSSAAIGGATGTIYAATNGATAGVYVSTDAGSTWTLTTSSPTTIARLVVSSTGVVWATDGANGGANGNLWRLTSSGGTWVKITAAGTGHSIAVDPANADHVVLGTAGGALNITSNSSATTPSWTGFTTTSRIATDCPALAQVNETSLSNGDMIFDGSALIFGEGIGVWTTVPQSGTTQWTSISAGIEQLVARDVIAPNGVAVVGVSDRSTWYLANPNSYPANYAAPYHDAFTLVATTGLDWAKTNTNYMAAISLDIAGLIPNNNNSGYSTDGGQTWFPFNSYYQDFAGSSSTITNNGSGLVRLTVPTTTGLNSWTPGTTDRSSIVRVVNYGVAPKTLRQYWPITVVDGTHIDLLGSTFASAMQAGRYYVYVDTAPLTSNNSLFNVTATASGTASRIKLTVTSTSGAMSDGTIVSVSNVGGTTEANGVWVSIGTSNPGNSFELYGSTFANAWTSGGVAAKTIPAGGAISVAEPLNIVLAGVGNDFPQYSADGGLTWTEQRVGTGGWIAASFLNRRPFAADFVTPNTFYLYNSLTGTYKLSGGVISLQSATIIGASNANATLRAVPGYAGHLFFAIGSQGAPGVGVSHPASGQLRRSTDGGATWQAISTTAEPYQVAIGAIAPGSDYPTVYMVGWISNVYGLWRTTATASDWASGSGTGTSVIWTKIIDYPLGSQDGVNALAADQLTWDTWYLGWNGSGFAYGQRN